MKEYKVRKLTRKDRCVLTALILRFVKKTGKDNLISMVPKKDESDKKNDDSSMLSFAVNLLTEMLKYIEEDIAPWFADLIGVKAEEFDSLPFDIEVNIIDQLISMKEFTDFFLKVLEVRKKIEVLVIQYQN